MTIRQTQTQSAESNPTFLVWAFAALMVVGLAANTAYADPALKLKADEQYTLVYSKKDFVSQDSVRDLHRKIVETAKSHCPSVYKTRSISTVNDCVDEVVEDLVRVIDHPTLTAYVKGEVDTRIAAEPTRIADPS